MIQFYVKSLRNDYRLICYFAFDFFYSFFLSKEKINSYIQLTVHTPNWKHAMNNKFFKFWSFERNWNGQKIDTLAFAQLKEWMHGPICPTNQQ